MKVDNDDKQIEDTSAICPVCSGKYEGPEKACPVCKTEVKSTVEEAVDTGKMCPICGIAELDANNFCPECKTTIKEIDDIIVTEEVPVGDFILEVGDKVTVVEESGDNTITLTEDIIIEGQEFKAGTILSIPKVAEEIKNDTFTLPMTIVVEGVEYVKGTQLKVVEDK